MPGRLFRVSQQYAALYEPSSKDTVIGDVVRFPEHLAGDILEGLDRYEGIVAGLSTPPPFKREVVRVQRPEGSWLDCWAWLCNHSVAGCSQIRHGDALSRV